MMKMRCKHKRRVRWGGALLAFVMAFGATFGVLGATQTTKALEGDPANWTATSGDGLTITVFSVQQNGVELAPVWDDYIYNDDLGGFGNYYFQVANSASEIRVGVVVDGMIEGNSYTIFDNRTITSEDNGQEIFEDMKPHVYSYQMGDGIDCQMIQGEEHCSYTPLINEYVLGLTVHENNWSDWISKNVIVRPEKIGSDNIEIVSVQQNGEDLVLDKVGRHVNTWEELDTIPQTLNEFAVEDYDTPIEVTYKFKNLEIGGYYSYSVGGDYKSFTANSSEETLTSELRLDYTKKHIESSVRLYGPGYNNDEVVNLYFRVADTQFRPLGDVVIDELSQNGVKIEPSLNDNGWMREYTFDVNDVQPITVNIHTTGATSEMNYYISYSGYSNGAYIHSREPFAVIGEELEGGTVLVIPAGYGLSEGSPISLNFTINTVGDNYGYGSQRIVYENYGESQTSDELYLNFYEDNELPRFGASMGYTDSDEEVFDVINAKYHDEEHPLWVRVEGMRYEDERQYEVHARVSDRNGEIYDEVFMATGEELNNGKTFVLEGLVLHLPEFDPNKGSSEYDQAFEFSLEINGLELQGTLYYMYDGWIYTMMTYPGGKVAASGAGGMGAAGPYLTSSAITVRKSSVGTGSGAVLHYLGSNFDEELDYDYAIYYNDDAGDSWWTAVAGTKVMEGTVSGEVLNSNGFSINVEVPESATGNSMYTLVISKNNGIVIISKDHLMFTEAPMVESFSFHADSDSFMQTSAHSYRLARGVEATATLTGAGFDDETEYRIWISYDGYHYVENENGGYGENVDLSELNDDVVVTGAELNAGYDYVLAYNETLNDVENTEIIFNVTERDNEKPDPYDWGGEGSYAGHMVYFDYVAEEDVFRGEGFQINEETGEIVDVSQPEEPGGFIDNRAASSAEAMVEGGILTVTSRKACVVVGIKDGVYSKVEAGMGEIVEGVTTNSYDVSEFDSVVVALKGNLDDRDQIVDLLDANVIYRSLLNPDSPAYRPLSPLEAALANLNGDTVIDLLDTNVIYRSLLNPDSPAYEAIGWD